MGKPRKLPRKFEMPWGNGSQYWPDGKFQRTPKALKDAPQIRQILVEMVKD